MATGINYVYVDRESISELLKCSICDNPLVDPISTNCQPKKHVFCRLCIAKSVARDASCPICHHQLANKNLVPIDDCYLIDALGELRINCKICNEKGLKRSNFNDHVNNVCPKSITTCPAKDMKCSWVGQRDELGSHLTTCIFTVLRPLFDELQEQIKVQQTQIDTLQSKKHKRSSSLITNVES
jgi:hypothetical protein